MTGARPSERQRPTPCLQQRPAHRARPLSWWVLLGGVGVALGCGLSPVVDPPSVSSDGNQGEGDYDGSISDGAGARGSTPSMGTGGKAPSPALGGAGAGGDGAGGVEAGGDGP